MRKVGGGKFLSPSSLVPRFNTDPNPAAGKPLLPDHPCFYLDFAGLQPVGELFSYRSAIQFRWRRSYSRSPMRLGKLQISRWICPDRIFDRSSSESNR